MQSLHRAFFRLHLQLYVATSADLQGVSGAYYTPIARSGGTGFHAQNAELQTRLWEESER
jgi:hypothetical protein